ncbi:Calcium/proton exchanger [Corynespora cassiicola Philippines]|uniref:Calcium/proton exchanger n=1 Tax=Corynespora cassiicola Philippines TaxID=1448308 RepID=A0A2T2N9H9_CORCC|nr:Calcium/proton exchanger [Corynespora cassiicola Philippines]
MHAVKRQAHRVARSVDKDSPSLNPFARMGFRGPADIENQVHRTRSETHAPGNLEEQRRLGGRQAEQHFPLPHHADTAPAPAQTHAPDSPQSVAGSATIQGSEVEKEMLPQSHTEAMDFNNNNNNTTASSNVGLTKRGKFKSMFKNDKQDDGTPSSEETGELTLAERKKMAFKRKIPVGQQFRAGFRANRWLCLFLLFVPVGFALYYCHVHPVAIFAINFVAIIPLAGILSYATEELALRVGETMGGLLNATFGNAVELIVSIQALLKNEITIVKTSLIGSMLSNLLLVLGMSFCLGGYNRIEQHFNVTVAQTAASLLALCIASLIIPTVFHNMIAEDDIVAGDAKKNQELSRGTAMILLFVYGCYLFFQLKSHVNMYNAPSQKVPTRSSSSKVEEGAASRGLAAIGAGTAAATGGTIHTTHIFHDPKADANDDNEDFEEPSLSVIGALVTLAVSTTLVAFCSEFMVSSIEGVTATGKVSTTFVGLILLPIVGNAAEHVTAITVAMKDKMDLSIGVAVGSSMQIALLVLPLVVVLGWILGKDCMTLYFDTFQIATLFVSVLLVNYLIQDGKSHWLEGVLLMASYLIIALASWFYPDVEEIC